MRYRLLLFIPVFVLLVSSCKKAVDKKKEDLLLDAITNGTWKVEQFKEGATDISGQFTGFIFQFTKDGTVTATKQNIVETGTWIGDINNLTITANFPNSSDPIKKLSGVFKVKDSSTTLVIAESTDKDPVNSLRLRKNE